MKTFVPRTPGYKRPGNVRPPSNKLFVVGIVGSTIILAILLGLLIEAAIASRRPKPAPTVPVPATVKPAPTPASREVKNLWPRTDFERTVLGRTTEEIRKLIGDPDQVVNDGRDGVQVVWRYNRRTYIPPGKVTDYYVLIHFTFPQDSPGGINAQGNPIINKPKNYDLQPASLVKYSDGFMTGG